MTRLPRLPHPVIDLTDERLTACIFWLKTRAHWKETTVNEVSVSIDPLAKLMQDIAERGRRIHDREPGRDNDRNEVDGVGSLTVIDGGLVPSHLLSSTSMEPA